MRGESNSGHAQSREFVYQAAVACFRRLGYTAAALTDIAAEAGVPLASVQQCFSSKEAAAIALVQAKFDELTRHIDSLAAGAMAHRYKQALTFAVQLLAQDRDAVAAVFARAMSDDAEFDIMAGSFARKLGAALERLVLQSDDALSAKQARDMGIALHSTLMLVLVFWCYDRSPEQQATSRLLDLVGDLFAQLRPLYLLPMAPQAVARLAGIMQPLLQSASVGAAAQEDTRDREHQDFDVHRD